MQKAHFCSVPCTFQSLPGSIGSRFFTRLNTPGTSMTLSRSFAMKTKPLNIQSLTWLSDIHLEFLRQRKIDDFARQVQAHPGKAVLITGDIATGDLLQSVLGTLARNIDRPIVYCLGNHDFYNSSFEKVEQAIAGAGQLFNNLIYLDGKSIIPLTEQTALIGINGWACGTGGIGRRTGIRLTDDTDILDFKCLPTDDDRFNLMFQLAKGYAETLRPTLRDALARFQNVIIGIHVPPFLEAAWHLVMRLLNNSYSLFSPRATFQARWILPRISSPLALQT